MEPAFKTPESLRSRGRGRAYRCEQTGQVMDGMSKKSDKSQLNSKDATAARERQRLIGRRLQTYFDDTIQEGVPDEFARLLDQLDEAEKRETAPSGGESDANSGKPGGAR